MSLASLQAGLAFSNASLGAVHALAHSLGGFLDMPHGECNALLLEHVVRFNFAARRGALSHGRRSAWHRYARHGRAECAQRIVDELARLRASVGIAGGLADRGVRAADIAELAVHAVKDACIFTNPGG
jgi:alcohol dehydrogenase